MTILDDETGWANTALRSTIHAQAWQERALLAEAEIQRLHKKVAELELAVTVQKARAQGLVLWKDAFFDAHPGSPISAPTGQKLKDGRPKTKGRLIFEQEFDRILRGARIQSPEQFREQ